MSTPRTAIVLACLLLTGCFQEGDQQAPQTQRDPVATAAPLPQLSVAPWEPTIITTDALKERLDAGEAMDLYDVRSRESYDTEHITGSRSLPWAKLETQVKSLSKARPIVLYCA